jgi:uncharacterized protein (TIGR00255 family)
MTLASMTGFARVTGAAGVWRWVWELKTVNSKSLDIRFRLPPGRDAIEPALRGAAAKTLQRGNLSVNLSLAREGAPLAVRINEEVLAAVLAAANELSRKVEMQPPRLDGLLGIKGVMETLEAEETERERETLHAALAASFETALHELVAMRAREGAAIGGVLNERVDEIERLTAAAEAHPSRTPEAIRERLAAQVAELLAATSKLDPERLHQEAALLAVRADIREEIDRLNAHVAAARALLGSGGAVGRKLDFLAQEFNREANTLCSKSNDAAVGALGLALKSAVDQFREQVQNLE